MNKLLKVFIVLSSEIIWIYYFIAFFTMVEWESPLFFNSFWLVAAAIVSYVLNWILAGRIHHVPLLLMNGIAIIFIIIQNWRLVVPDESIFFGVIVSIVTFFIFLRSGQLVFKEPPRLQMLVHFEGNIVIYVIFAFFFTDNQVFHGIFLFAIFLSLLGMVLTLQNHGQDESESDVEIHKVGNSGWLSAVMGILFASVALVSFLLFLPSIRQMLQSFAQTGWSSVKWLFNQAITFFVWLFNFLPDSEPGEIIGDMSPQGAVSAEEIPEEMLMSIPTSLLVTIGIVIGLGILLLIIWLTTQFLKKWKIPKQSKVQRVFTFQGSWWKQLTKSLHSFFKVIQRKWRVRFSPYYRETVYWYYYKLQRWGKKNGISQVASETSKEYIEKMISIFQEQEVLNKNEKELLIVDLRKMNDAYQAAYYGKQHTTDSETYRMLLQQLKGIKLNKSSVQAYKQHQVKPLILKKN